MTEAPLVVLAIHTARTNYIPFLSRDMIETWIASVGRALLARPQAPVILSRRTSPPLVRPTGTESAA